MMEDEVASSFEDAQSKGRGRIRYPMSALFHLLFKVSAIVVYVIFTSLISGHFIEFFLTIILLLAVDFWMVKNVTGRRLVGLRWWNKVEEDGTSNWVFESRKEQSSHPEVLVFWGGLLGCTVLWVFFCFTALIKFNWNWALIPVIAIALNGANLIGYVKCRRDAGARLTQMAGKFIGQQILTQALQSK